MQYRIRYSCLSHSGSIRKLNQDNFFCGGQLLTNPHTNMAVPICGEQLHKTQPLFAVFDGLGGEECGEIASSIAAQAASKFTPGKDAIEHLQSFCTNVNASICQYIAAHGLTAMGTTAAMLLFTPRQILLCNIGDSKVFQFSAGELRQISMDHVSVCAFGQKPPLSQSLGIPPTEMIIEPYLSQGKYTAGDRYLLCSDGLTDMVSTEKIAEIMAAHPIEQAAPLLLAQALDQGGKDNITILLLEIRNNNLFSHFGRKSEEKRL